MVSEWFQFVSSGFTMVSEWFHNCFRLFQVVSGGFTMVSGGYKGIMGM